MVRAGQALNPEPPTTGQFSRKSIAGTNRRGVLRTYKVGGVLPVQIGGVTGRR